MKKLSAYLFLFLFSFSAPSFAEDIFEYQIEGFSIGDSLLDFYSVDEIYDSIDPNVYKKPYHHNDLSRCKIHPTATLTKTINENYLHIYHSLLVAVDHRVVINLLVVTVYL